MNGNPSQTPIDPAMQMPQQPQANQGMPMAQPPVGGLQ